MHVTFYGAIREVTGSMHLLETGKDTLLLDCGLYQGRRKESEDEKYTNELVHVSILLIKIVYYCQNSIIRDQ